VYRFSEGASLLKTVFGGCFPDPEPLGSASPSVPVASGEPVCSSP